MSSLVARMQLCFFLFMVHSCAAEQAEVSEATGNLAAEGKAENKTSLLAARACRDYFLHIAAHGDGFWDVKNLERYNRCLWVLRHTREAPRQVFVGGKHFPTLLVANHREPEMQVPPLKPPRVPRKRYGDIPLQPFQDTQADFAGFERRVPHHFVVPFYDTNIGNAIKNQGSMNHHQSYHMQLMLREGDTVLDVGANLGCYTVAMAEAVGPRGRVLAFEPYRSLHQLVTANVALNGLSNVWPVQAALGARTETVPLLPPQMRFFSSPGGVRVLKQAEHYQGKPHHEGFQLYDLLAHEAELVRIVRLDDLLLNTEEGLHWGLPMPIKDVRLMKIDVEGMEAQVLEGAAAVIRAFKPIVWSENIAYFDSNGKDVEFLGLMANLGYACSKIEVAPTDLLCTDAQGQGHTY